MAKETKNFGKTILNALNEIFTPIIPALIGGGLVAGIGKMLQSFGVDASLTWMKVLILIGFSAYTYIIILVAMNSAKYIGGSPALGAVAGMIMINPSLTDIGLTVGRGGVFGAVLAGLLIAVIEKKVKEIAPKALKIHLPPFVALIVAGVIILYVLQPVTGWFSNILTSFILWMLDKGGAVAGSVIAALYLPLVMTGMHHGLTPIHLQLIEEVGYSTLQTLNSMAGAGQVGAALALLLKFRNDENFKNIIKGALPVGILGIGEPLIYGVTLPLFKPFITACLGAAVGGAIVGFLGFGARAVYVSGILAIATNSNVLYYIISYSAAVLAGFVFTSLLKFPEKKVEE
jgi:PTS system sucrose-specific IIC component